MIKTLDKQIILRFSCVFDTGHLDYEPIYLIAAALNPSTVVLLDDSEISFAQLSLIPLVYIFYINALYKYFVDVNFVYF